MLSAKDIANYFLTLADPEIGEGISNLKLQKLCYYAQGFYLAIYDKPLFDEPIRAWAHGPVVESLYREYKDYEANIIPIPDDIDLSIYEPATQEFLNEVYSVYGQYSAWKLRNMTHEEPPWKEAYKAGASIISHDSMKAYFATLVING